MSRAGLAQGSRFLAEIVALVLALMMPFGQFRGMTPVARAQQRSAPGATMAPGGNQNPQGSVSAGASASPAPTPVPRFTVFLDAAHGGPETGARLSSTLDEKDLVLALSVRLRSLLTAHGIAVVTTRESDSGPALNLRAAIANRAQASACLLLHATASGTGVHLYTAALAPEPAPSGLRPWATAQAPYLTQSLKLSSELSTALGQAGIPVILGSISLAPVDNIACPAVILEVAPLLPRRGKAGAPLSDPEYQTRLIDAIAGSIEQWRADWRSEVRPGTRLDMHLEGRTTSGVDGVAEAGKVQP